KPAYEMLESDPDWVPSLHLGHTEGQHRHPERPLHSAPRDGLQVRRRRKCPSKSTQKDRDQIKKRLKRLLQSAQQDRAHNQRCPAEMRPSQETETAAATGAERPSVRPWREVKSLLQSALQRQSNFSKQPAKKSDRDFREFFRDALEAALEASSRSRAFAASSGDASMSFKLPPVNQPSSSSCSCCASSSCVCCARLQRRIIELQEKLSRLRGGQEDMETSPVLYEAPVQSEQELQSPEEQEEEEKEEEEPACESEKPPNDSVGMMKRHRLFLSFTQKNMN
ncbi:uncharacterized protein LOC121965964, partial [Plectropomus leopardus]|uniref:uncharacterized protein LOC121965964 n=1 Tax=Plectropomus leopardus TaxID=160734 RepID=UPI001C4B13C3